MWSEWMCLKFKSYEIFQIFFEMIIFEYFKDGLISNIPQKTYRYYTVYKMILIFHRIFWINPIISYGIFKFYEISSILNI